MNFGWSFLRHILRLSTQKHDPSAPQLQLSLNEKEEKKSALLLRRQMLREHLHAILRLELPDEPRVPQLAGHAEVLAAAHERVRFAGFGRGGDAGGVEVFLFAAGDGDEAGWGGREGS